MDERTAWLTLSLWGGTLARPVREALAHGVAPQDLVEGRVPSQRLAAVLRKRPRVSVAKLHGDLEQKDRDRVMAKLRNQSVRVLVASILLAVAAYVASRPEQVLVLDADPR